MWVITIAHYPELPDTIPVKYDGKGQVTNYGNKETILILPAIATIVLIGLSTLNMVPHIFNYPMKITAQNSLRQYTNATRMIRHLKFAIGVVFFLVVISIIQTSSEKSGAPGDWFMLLILGIIFIPVIYYTFNAFRTNN